MVRRFLLVILPIFVIITLLTPACAFAAGTTISAQTLMPKVKLFFPSRSGTFTEGSTFEVPILIDTNNNSINTVELYVQFDPHKLQVVKPAGDKSIISIWLQPPSFTNTEGRAKIVGAIPNGISTSNGVVTTITFKAIETGDATVRILEGSRVLANNGNGTDLLAQFDSARFNIIPVPPGGLKVYSETHPFDDHWYNNNSPVLSWEADEKIAGVSYVFDHEPFTIPDNTIDATDNVKAYENLEDGLWYFHIKAQRNKIWGATTHFLVRIDTTAPAEFTPKQDILSAATIKPTLVSYFTTDALSGIDHYEVGIIEGGASSSPLFVQADSPYQVPPTVSGNAKVVVKAYDRAGNVRTASTDIVVTGSIMGFITAHLNDLVMLILLLILLLIILHYVFSHKIFHRLHKALQALNDDETKPKPAPAAMPIPVPVPVAEPVQTRFPRPIPTPFSQPSPLPVEHEFPTPTSHLESKKDALISAPVETSTAFQAPPPKEDLSLEGVAKPREVPAPKVVVKIKPKVIEPIPEPEEILAPLEMKEVDMPVAEPIVEEKDEELAPLEILPVEPKVAIKKKPIYSFPTEPIEEAPRKRQPVYTVSDN